MTLRTSIHAALLATALYAAAVGTALAAEATPDSAAAGVPRLIDPQSPPPSERAQAVTAPPAAPLTVAIRGAEAQAAPAAAPANDAVLNQPAVDDIELQMNADVLKYIAFFTGAGRSTFERWLKRS